MAHATSAKPTVSFANPTLNVLNVPMDITSNKMEDVNQDHLIVLKLIVDIFLMMLLCVGNVNMDIRYNWEIVILVVMHFIM